MACTQAANEARRASEVERAAAAEGLAQERRCRIELEAQLAHTCARGPDPPAAPSKPQQGAGGQNGASTGPAGSPSLLMQQQEGVRERQTRQDSAQASEQAQEAPLGEAGAAQKCTRSDAELQTRAELETQARYRAEAAASELRARLERTAAAEQGLRERCDALATEAEAARAAAAAAVSQRDGAAELQAENARLAGEVAALQTHVASLPDEEHAELHAENIRLAGEAAMLRAESDALRAGVEQVSIIVSESGKRLFVLSVLC